MTRNLLTLSALLVFAFITNAQTKKDGTPDMRYGVNKQSYGSHHSTKSYNTNSDTRYQSGYYQSNGTYVDPHRKTSNNATNHDNFSSKGNYNSYTGSTGTRAKDYSSEAKNYGSGKTINTGPKGGQYYYNSAGNKIYVPKNDFK